jgi:hypothetical protein
VHTSRTCPTARRQLCHSEVVGSACSAAACCRRRQLLQHTPHAAWKATCGLSLPPCLPCCACLCAPVRAACALCPARTVPVCDERRRTRRARAWASCAAGPSRASWRLAATGTTSWTQPSLASLPQQPRARTRTPREQQRRAAAACGAAQRTSWGAGGSTGGGCTGGDCAARQLLLAVQGVGRGSAGHDGHDEAHSHPHVTAAARRSACAGACHAAQLVFDASSIHTTSCHGILPRANGARAAGIGVHAATTGCVCGGKERGQSKAAGCHAAKRGVSMHRAVCVAGACAGALGLRDGGGTTQRMLLDHSFGLAQGHAPAQPAASVAVCVQSLGGVHARCAVCTERRSSQSMLCTGNSLAHVTHCRLRRYVGAVAAARTAAARTAAAGRWLGAVGEARRPAGALHEAGRAERLVLLAWQRAPAKRKPARRHARRAHSDASAAGGVHGDSNALAAGTSLCCKDGSVTRQRTAAAHWQEKSS